MWFHFCTANHDPVGRATLVDMAAWFEAGLLDLGHKVTFSDSGVESGAINLFWECFTPGMGKAIRQTGVQYGIIATEIPDGYAFNWRNESYWKTRFEAFPEAAEGASFIWAMVESTVPYYSTFCPTAFIELGFSSRLIPSLLNGSPEFDFSFFGLRTPYRIEVVDRLRKHAKVEWPERFLAATEVQELIGSTKVGLNFKQSEQWPIPSPTRLGRLIMAKRDVASEKTQVATRQGKIIGLPLDGQDFVEFALERLSANWRERAENTFEQYRTKMPMSLIMDQVFEKTIEGLNIQRNGNRTISLSFTQPPVLVKTVNNWNIVYWNKVYYALLHGCGNIDVRDGFDVLRSIHGKGTVYCAGSLEEILAVVLKHDKPFIRLGKSIVSFLWPILLAWVRIRRLLKNTRS